MELGPIIPHPTTLEKSRMGDLANFNLGFSQFQSLCILHQGAMCVMMDGAREASQQRMDCLQGEEKQIF